MVSKVLYRPFEESDFDAIASMLQKIWHTSADDDAYNFLSACDDLAYSLSVSTFSQVVVVDDAPCGIVLARAGQDRSPRAGRWEQAEHDFLAQMRRVDPEETERTMAFIRSEHAVNSAMLEDSALADADEITLLAVSAEARGMGIGGVLLDAAVSYLSSHGARAAYLYTDTNCSWSFYERHGFTRAASHRSTREERKLLPREMYLYGLDLSA